MKRILFDENMPRKLRHDMQSFVVRTVQEEGWAGLKNGNLLRNASTGFDVLITVDQGMRFQQNLAQFKIAVVVIETFDTTLTSLRRLLPQLNLAIEHAVPGTVSVINAL